MSETNNKATGTSQEPGDEVPLAAAPEASETSAQTPVTVSGAETAESGGSGRGLAWLALCLSLLALGSMLAVAWLGHQLAGEQRQADSELRQTLQGKASSSEVRGLHTQLEQLMLADRELQRVQQELQQGLLHVLAATSKDNLLAELDYLLRLAQLRLTFEQDVQQATILLQQALNRLQEAPQPATLALREALQLDIQRLQAVSGTDVQLLALQLLQLADQVALLQLPALPQMAVEENQVTAPGSSAWYQLLWQELKSLIVITRHETPAALPALYQQSPLLRSEMRLLLQQAAWAALRHDDELYQISLARVASHLMQFAEDEVHQEVAAQLNALRNTDVRAQQLDIAASQAQLALLQQQEPTP